MENTDYEPNFQKYTIEAEETDMRTISVLFGGEILDRLNSEDTFTKIDAQIESMFASSHMLFRLAALNKETLNVDTDIAKTFNKLALIFAKVAKDLLDKNEEAYKEGLFNQLTKEDLKPIMDILNNIEVELPEGL